MECNINGAPTSHVVALKVEGMSCMHCVNAVTNALEGVDGVKNADVDFETGNAIVTYSGDKSTVEKMKQAVVDAGYKTA